LCGTAVIHRVGRGDFFGHWETLDQLSVTTPSDVIYHCHFEESLPPANCERLTWRGEFNPRLVMNEEFSSDMFDERARSPFVVCQSEGSLDNPVPSVVIGGKAIHIPTTPT